MSAVGGRRGGGGGVVTGEPQSGKKIFVVDFFISLFVLLENEYGEAVALMFSLTSYLVLLVNQQCKKK